MPSEEITDKDLIAQLLREEPAAFNSLYKLYFSSIANHIQNNNGTLHDAEDIFQESLLQVLQKIRDPNFTLTASIHTYLFAIAKNLWLKKLSADQRAKKMVNDINISDNYDVNDIYEHPQEQKIISWLSQITLNCQRILKAIFFKKKPMDLVIKEMGWKNKHTAANQKYKCIEQIRKESKK